MHDSGRSASDDLEGKEVKSFHRLEPVKAYTFGTLTCGRCRDVPVDVDTRMRNKLFIAQIT